MPFLLLMLVYRYHALPVLQMDAVGPHATASMMVKDETQIPNVK